jgi:pimeloyl-ACP methyl ester carboxylesterase
MNALETSGLGGGFKQHRIAAYGIELNVVEGGEGPPLLLVSGWPQTWYAWRKVMPELARHFHVIAVDPPGLGDSDAPLGGYDTGSISLYLDPVLDAFGADDCLLVGHDVGTWISYAYAVRRPERVRRMALIDAAIPGLTPADAYSLSPQAMHKTWHFAFNYIPELSETLVIGREREFLTWLFRTKSVDWAVAFDETAVDEYVRAYSAPGRWSTGLGYYRSIFDSISQNGPEGRVPLPMPVLTVGGETGLGAVMAKALSGAASDVQNAVIASCGHYVPEESPAALLDVLMPFLQATGVR